MSNTKKKRSSRNGTPDKQTLAALEFPDTGHEARSPAEPKANDMNVKEAIPAHEPIESEPVDAAEAEAIAPSLSAAGSKPSKPAPQSLGERLRQGRENRGWSAEDVGSRLHLPVQIIHRLEAEQYERIGYGIYLRGYLSNYARLVEVPTVLVDAVVRQHEQTPPLVTSGTISHSRYLYQRYSVSALYLILTGVIIVPAVLLAMRAGLQPTVAELTALVPPASTSTDATLPSATENSPAATTPPASETTTVAGNDVPLVASLAPFSALGHKEAPVHSEMPSAAAPVAGAHTLKLILREASWVEVTSGSGEKLEYGLLPAGSTRTYASGSALEVRIGNCNGAEVETDGKAQELAPFRRANIAHFKVFSGGEAISRTD